VVSPDEPLSAGAPGETPTGTSGQAPTQADGQAPTEARGDLAAPPVAGARILWWNRWATVVFVVVSLGAAVAPDPLERLSVPVDLVLFAVGCGAFLWAYALAIGRSRYELVTMGGVFFLAGGVAPRAVALELQIALAVQTVVGVGVAAARPFTALAFSVLVPMFGLGMMALWGARHGAFTPRDAAPCAGADPAEGPAAAQ
jgi:hypothetical protein